MVYHSRSEPFAAAVQGLAACCSTSAGPEHVFAAVVEPGTAVVFAAGAATAAFGMLAEGTFAFPAACPAGSAHSAEDSGFVADANLGILGY
eukprot:CAMPEP_0184754734 /NCGR_PEP_ID=MMETSP0315-20130426/44776_1 /TAXON_ID=101924 /ORGANISM="Rhodosorus marinus, Strain UTEX LB 2760" /LENGTH=90 /DNA_ID=CAMNT_0027234169 /DNA_START=541 /DNA_END=813 /DNA_ORIENTATION=+